MRGGLKWLLVGIAAALVVLAALGGAAGEWVTGAWGAAIAGVAGFGVPALWDQARERRAERQAARERLDAVCEAVVVERESGDASGDVAGALSPARRVVDFVGRSTELKRLHEWCDDDSAMRLALVTGPGGVGKTRLALHLAGRLQEQGWSCRWVRDGDEAAVVAAVEAALPGRPVLLVVDYAETRPGLRELLASAVASDVARLRVLLLARGQGEWWDRLEAAASPAGSAVARALTLPLEADPEAELSDRELVAAAVPQFARYFHLPEPPGVEVELSAGPVPLLVLHAAALVAVLRTMEQDGPTPGRVVADLGVLDELLRHETRYWYASARQADLTGPQGLGTVEVQRCIAVTSLLGAESETTAADLLCTVPGLGSDAHAGLRRKTARWLSQLYPGPAPGSVGSIQPDLLAEHHITTHLHRTPELADTLRDRLDSTSAPRALTVLTRAHTHQPHAVGLLTNWLRQRLEDLHYPAIAVAIETPGPLGQIMADVLADTDAPLAVLVLIKCAMPYPTVALADADFTVTQRIVKDLPEDTEPAHRAYWLSFLGVLRQQAGRVEEALAPTQEAIGLYRELAAAAPQRFDLNLALSLNNLGIHLTDLRRVQEALTPAEEAVAMFRELATVEPEPFRPYLAGTLSNLGNRLSNLKRVKEALEAAQESVKLYGELAAAEPERFRPDLAMALNNLGSSLSDLGRVEEALASTQEAVAIRRGLAAEAPERFRPDLAGSLNNLGAQLSKLGRLEAAVAPALEAVAIRRELAAEAPERFRPDLGGSLNNLGNVLSELGREEEAQPYWDEAAALAAEPDA